MTLEEIILKIKENHPSIHLEARDVFSWSPKTATIYYIPDNNDRNSWSLLHELGHALLNHKKFSGDINLLMMEIEAWEKAKDISKSYDITIPNEHIEDCIDTYRDWIHNRSKCPKCDNNTIQENSSSYRCFNCDFCWSVSIDQLCRVYRSPISKIGSPTL